MLCRQPGKTQQRWEGQGLGPWERALRPSGFRSREVGRKEQGYMLTLLLATLGAVGELPSFSDLSFLYL